MTGYLTREEQISAIYQKWQRMTITSDPMFGLVMQNKEICLELINRALPQLKAQAITQFSTQKDINLVGAHRVRFDVYVRDEKNDIFVIEMQVNNKHNLPARLRYYQEQIDHNLLHPGEGYSMLSQCPTYIIMFCNFDYFGRGWPRYEFHLTCTQDHELQFNDHRQIIIFNALAKEFDKGSLPIKDFLALMQNRINNKSKFIAQIENEINRVKHDPQRRNGFMTYELNLMDAKQQGQEEERKEAINKLITTLQEVGIAPAIIKQKIMEKYGLSDAEVDKLLKQYN